MRYHLYVDLANSRARVHREDCSRAQNRCTSNRKDGYWEEFLSRDEAFLKMEQTGMRVCKECFYCERKSLPSY